MTENKRFSYHIDEVGIYYYVCDNTKESYDRIILEVNTKYDAIEVCNVLNELNNESEQLKSDLNDLCEERNYFERKKYEYWIKFNHTHLDNINLRKENEQLKQSQSEAIELILDAIVEMHDGKRDYAEKLLNEAIGLI